MIIGQIWLGVAALFTCLYMRGHYHPPHIWLMAILTGILPIGLSLTYPLWEQALPLGHYGVTFQMNEAIHQTYGALEAKGWTMNFAWLYFGVSGGLVLRTLLRWGRLQIRRLQGTELEHVYVTDTLTPPHILSWPRRVIVFPKTLYETMGKDLGAKDVGSSDMRQKLIAHEMSHLENYDGEITLLLLCLKDIFWINPACHYLVNGWRLSAEIRADKAALQDVNVDMRYTYASLLLAAMSHKNGEKALPCPSAYLNPSQKRSMKMRLSEIMSQSNNQGKPWQRRLFMMGSAGLISSATISLSALAAPHAFLGADRDALPIKRVPPHMPEMCPGLSLDDIEFAKMDISVENQDKTLTSELAKVGKVKVEFDVDRNGQPHNIKVIESNHECFNQPSIKSVEKWVYEKGRVYNSVQTRIDFALIKNRDEPDTLADALQEFVGK